MHRRIVMASALCCFMFLLIGGALLAQQGAPPPEANRPPVFFHEAWKHQFDTGGAPEGPLGPQHVSSPDLEYRLYGEEPKPDTGTGPNAAHTHEGMWMNKRFKEDPAHIFTGTCNRPCGLTLRNKTSYVNLADFGTKIRWQVKESGFHQIRPLIRLADGTYLVGDHTDGWVDGFDWYISEFNISSVRWRRFDPVKVISIVGQGTDAKGWFTNPDLSKVDEVGFVDLMPGSSHGNGGFSDVGWVEVIGRPVPRTGSTSAR